MENVARTIIYYIKTINIIVKFSNTTPLPLMIWGGSKNLNWQQFWGV